MNNEYRWFTRSIINKAFTKLNAKMSIIVNDGINFKRYQHLEGDMWSQRAVDKHLVVVEIQNG